MARNCEMGSSSTRIGGGASDGFFLAAPQCDWWVANEHEVIYEQDKPTLCTVLELGAEEQILRTVSVELCGEGRNDDLFTCLEQIFQKRCELMVWEGTMFIDLLGKCRRTFIWTILVNNN